MEDDDLLAPASDSDDLESDDELLAAKPKGGSGVTDGTSNT